MTQKIMI